jgi:hypothetical protein
VIWLDDESSWDSTSLKWLLKDMPDILPNLRTVSMAFGFHDLEVLDQILAARSTLQYLRIRCQITIALPELTDSLVKHEKIVSLYLKANRYSGISLPTPPPHYKTCKNLTKLSLEVSSVGYQRFFQELPIFPHLVSLRCYILGTGWYDDALQEVAEACRGFHTRGSKYENLAIIMIPTLKDKLCFSLVESSFMPITNLANLKQLYLSIGSQAHVNCEILREISSKLRNLTSLYFIRVPACPERTSYDIVCQTGPHSRDEQVYSVRGGVCGERLILDFNQVIEFAAELPGLKHLGISFKVKSLPRIDLQTLVEKLHVGTSRIDEALNANELSDNMREIFPQLKMGTCSPETFFPENSSHFSKWFTAFIRLKVFQGEDSMVMDPERDHNVSLLG